MTTFGDAVQFVNDFGDARSGQLDGPVGKPYTPHWMVGHLFGDLVRREAGGEPYEGQLLVAWVVLWRVRSPARWWGRTPLTVMLAPKQFSCYDHVTDTEPTGAGVAAFLGTLSADRRCERVAEAAMSGWLEFPEVMTHYHALSVSPSWASAPGMTFVREVGGHRFYCED